MLTPTMVAFLISRLVVDSTRGFSEIDTDFRLAGSVVESAVAETASLTLLGLGLAGMAGRRWRQRKQ